MDQAVVEYLFLLMSGVEAEAVGLPGQACAQAPLPSRSFFARAGRKGRSVWFRTLDAVGTALGSKPSLRHLGKPWIRDWLRSLGLDLIYFPSAWHHELLTDVPVAVTIHDMQHVHFPEWWSHDAFQRQTVFGWYRDHAALVTCNFNHVAEDLAFHLKIPKDRLASITLSVPFHEEGNVSEDYVAKKYGLPPRYLIYPAAAWPSKNHLSLVRAVARCARKGLDCFCVCTGETADWLYPGQHEKIRAEMKKLGVEHRFHFTGNIPLAELVALERGAEFFCVPTLYEAGSYPVWEAFALGRAVACSDVTALPHQVGDAGILFNPYDDEDIARAIEALWTNRELRARLAEKGSQRARDPSVSRERMGLGYHRAFVNCLVRLGRLPSSAYVREDPAPPIDRGPKPPRFEWRGC